MPPSNPGRPVALVTGASRRIGRTIALALARDGYDIAIHYRRTRSEAETLAAEIAALGARTVIVPADLADHGDVVALVPAATAALAAPTCLINNASEFEDDSAKTMTAETWARHLDVNLKAPVFLAQAMAAALPPDATGTIINIIDQRVWRTTPEFFTYSLSKSALWDATRMLAQALAPRIRVNAIGPGPILQSVHQTPAEFATEAAATLLQRGSSPDEIAAAVRFILSAPAMTGQMIALDGGQHLAWR
jgi:NAD(P)-dependent dehydrogenase (short-subunit alcohol dehydrogenase family)